MSCNPMRIGISDCNNGSLDFMPSNQYFYNKKESDGRFAKIGDTFSIKYFVNFNTNALSELSKLTPKANEIALATNTNTGKKELWYFDGSGWHIINNDAGSVVVPVWKNAGFRTSGDNIVLNDLIPTGKKTHILIKTQYNLGLGNEEKIISIWVLDSNSGQEKVISELDGVTIVVNPHFSGTDINGFEIGFELAGSVYKYKYTKHPEIVQEIWYKEED